MPIDYAYAQARVQARRGARAGEAEWRALEACRGLAEYLHVARRTPLAPLVQNFVATSSPHVIERSLRLHWRREVDAAAQWVPKSWRRPIQEIAWLPYLASIGHLEKGGRVYPWMLDDPLLSAFVPTENGSTEEPLTSWWRRWQEHWPDTSSLPELERLVRSAMEATADRSSLEELETGAFRLMRKHIQQPIVVFCHLLLTALDFQRLRGGLVRRALFNDLTGRQA